MSQRRGPPFTIRQVRGASYPPLTAPPSRGSGRAAPAGTPAAAPSAGAPSGSRASPPAPAPARAPSAAPAAAAPSTSRPAADPTVVLSREAQRLKLFDRLLKEVEVVDLAKLRPASWSGIPEQHRPVCWQLLLGYLPSNLEWRADTLQRKRREYWASVPQYFDVDDAERSQYQKDTLHQILMDVPRTCPSSRLLHHEVVQRALERILYIWALRHPASGYVQGINDLVTPFFMVFLSEHLPHDRPHTVEDVDAIPPAMLAQVEADAYWCLSKLLDSIQDHYTFAQPGIQRMVFKLKEIVARIDAPLHAHLAEQGLSFIQFAFRWMNCLLMRELSLDLIYRVWDTYLAEIGGTDDTNAFGMAYQVGAASQSEGFAVLHVYMCVALLVRWSAELQALEFQDLVMFLQELPTSGWSSADVGALLSQAFVYMSLYHNAPNHLRVTQAT